jgi:hypothetical protein
MKENRPKKMSVGNDFLKKLISIIKAVCANLQHKKTVEKEGIINTF